MKTHELLRTALALAGSSKSFSASGPGCGLVFPDGWFTRRLCARPGRRTAHWADLRLAPSELGVARVELTFTLPDVADDAITVALYEEVNFLWARGYRCHFSRVPGSTRLQLRSHVFISPPKTTDGDDTDDIPTVADANELASWVRVSMAACRTVLVACTGVR